MGLWNVVDRGSRKCSLVKEWCIRRGSYVENLVFCRRGETSGNDRSGWQDLNSWHMALKIDVPLSGYVLIAWGRPLTGVGGRKRG